MNLEPRRYNIHSISCNNIPRHDFILFEIGSISLGERVRLLTNQSMDQSHKLKDLTLSSYLAMMMLMRMNHAAYLYLLGDVAANQSLINIYPRLGLNQDKLVELGRRAQSVLDPRVWYSSLVWISVVPLRIQAQTHGYYIFH